MSGLYPSQNTYKLLNIIENMSESQVDELLRYANELYHTKRNHIRKDCIVAIEYADAQNLSKGVIENISSGGAYIRPRGTMEVGKTVTLTFENPLNKVTVKISGKIVREDANGVGVAFSKPLKELNELYDTANGHGG